MTGVHIRRWIWPFYNDINAEGGDTVFLTVWNVQNGDDTGSAFSDYVYIANELIYLWLLVQIYLVIYFSSRDDPCATGSRFCVGFKSFPR